MKQKTYNYDELADALISIGAVQDMATDTDGWKRLALMFAELGEDAFPIFDKISASASNYNSKQTYSIFRWALNHYNGKVTIASFLFLCRQAGIHIEDYAMYEGNCEEKPSVEKQIKTADHDTKLPADTSLFCIPTEWIQTRIPESYNASPLARFFADKFGWQSVNATFSLYFVGLTDKTINIDCQHSLPIGSCIFPQVDENGFCRTAQIMSFDDESGNWGHRTKYDNGNKSALTWMHSIMMPELLERTNGLWGREDYPTRKPYNCIYGAHLLNEKKHPTLSGKTVGIVESMSTALCMTCAKPDYIWLATGGASNILLLKDAIERDAPSLKKRKIIVFPDEGKYNQWKKFISNMELANIYVSDFMENRNFPGGDLRDIIMSYKELLSDLPNTETAKIPTILDRFILKYPELENFAEKLKLEVI